MKSRNCLRIRNLFLVLFSFFYTIKSSVAQIYLIRDAEIENYVKNVLEPLVKAGKLPYGSIQIHLLKNDEINAFVSGGRNIFINTGLLQSSENYEELQAVLAHELGHITSSHLISFSRNVNNALLEALFYSVSGALIMLGGGGGAESLIAALSLGSNVAEKRVLSYSRKQESEADFAAVRYLQTLRSSGQGAIKVFKKFNLLQEKMVDISKVDQYSITHPFASERLNFFQQKFSFLPYKPVFDASLNHDALLVNAKLAGYFNNGSVIFTESFKHDNTANKYFLAFDNFRKNNLNAAKQGFLELINKNPEKPFFYEAMGEAFTKEGDFKGALQYYKKAADLMPNNFVLLFELAETLALLKNYSEAIKVMHEAFRLEPYNPQCAFRLAGYYNSLGNIINAKIYFLETEVLRENYKKAKFLLKTIKNSKIAVDESQRKKLEDIEETLQLK